MTVTDNTDAKARTRRATSSGWGCPLPVSVLSGGWSLPQKRDAETKASAGTRKSRLRGEHGKREQNQRQGGWATEMPERRKEHRRQTEWANQSTLRADGRTTEHRRRRRRTKRATGNGHSQTHKLRQSNNRRRRVVSGRRQPPAQATSPRSPCRQDAERKPRVPTAPRQRVRTAPRRSER